MMRWTRLAPITVTMAAAPVAAMPAASTPQQQIESAMLDSAAGWNAGDLTRFVSMRGT